LPKNGPLLMNRASGRLLASAAKGGVDLGDGAGVDEAKLPQRKVPWTHSPDLNGGASAHRVVLLAGVLFGDDMASFESGAFISSAIIAAFRRALACFPRNPAQALRGSPATTLSATTVGSSDST